MDFKKIAGVLVGTTALVSAQNAAAVVPPEVTAAFTEATADVGIIGTATLLAVVAVAVFGYLKAVVI